MRTLLYKYTTIIHVSEPFYMHPQDNYNINIPYYRNTRK